MHPKSISESTDSTPSPQWTQDTFQIPIVIWEKTNSPIAFPFDAIVILHTEQGNIGVQTIWALRFSPNWFRRKKKKKKNKKKKKKISHRQQGPFPTSSSPFKRCREAGCFW